MPKEVRLSKTAYNMTQDWQQREGLIFNTNTMYGYPAQKKEVTKIRYIVNTDLPSHYQLTPIETWLSKLMKNSQVFNYADTEYQERVQKRWLFKPRTTKFFCADQSSFDHYCSKHSFD